MFVAVSVFDRAGMVLFMAFCWSTLWWTFQQLCGTNPSWKLRNHVKSLTSKQHFGPTATHTSYCQTPSSTTLT